MTLQENDDMVVVICVEPSPLASRCWLKMLAREIYAIKADVALTHPSKCYEFPISFDHHH
jgi:hypothetical protein